MINDFQVNPNSIVKLRDNFWILPDPKSLQTTMKIVTQFKDVAPVGKKSSWKKEKLLNLSNFSFSHDDSESQL